MHRFLFDTPLPSQNDHQPVFEQAAYHAAVRESVPVGTTVVTVRATDKDSGSNAELEYSILNPTGANEVFRIDAHTGMISTRGALDRETRECFPLAFCGSAATSCPLLVANASSTVAVNKYTLTVQASDLGPLPTRKNAQTTVDITVLDDNDNVSLSCWCMAPEIARVV